MAEGLLVTTSSREVLDWSVGSLVVGDASWGYALGTCCICPSGCLSLSCLDSATTMRKVSGVALLGHM
jgi:hypothetical protein